jgi:HAD superfamily hydrolase (TIGR01509 family)
MGETVSLDGTDAWVFDLDGVLTDTARLHRQAWTELFDELFEVVAAEGSAAPRAFTGDDYRRLVDGEARLDGVRHVLDDRGIVVPEGSDDDEAGLGTMWGLAKEKDARYLRLLESRGPGPFPSSVELLGQLRAAGVGVAVVSASRHCAQVLESAGLDLLVDVRVDGDTALVMALPGKPDPAMFVEAARRLGVEPSRAVVVEDALAGVEAGRRGEFAHVVGVDRAGGRSDEFRRHGADLVVADLGELSVAGSGPATNPWWLTYHDPAPADEGSVEALCTLANGYLGTRGARPWVRHDDVFHPGTYLAGVYDRLRSPAGGEPVEVESLVNAPNWLTVSFRAVDGDWLGGGGTVASEHRIALDLRRGLLIRRCLVTDQVGRRTALLERRVVSMADPHLVALEVSCTPLNWSGTLELRLALDGDVEDDETVEERLLGSRHLEAVDQGGDDDGGLWLRVRTVQSQVMLAMAARSRLSGSVAGARWVHGGTPGSPAATVVVEAQAGGRVTVDKTVAVFTSRDRAISEPGLAARRTLSDAPDFDDLLADQRRAWEPLWRQAAIDAHEDDATSRVLHLHQFHLMQVASPHLVDLDAGLGARGLHGEGYRGHVFWDTMFAYPVLNLHFPPVSRAVLAYRNRRLPEARRAAAALGLRGARFPWQSGSDGRDETPDRLFNPRSGRWMPDRSGYQVHVGLAIAFDTWQHWQVTGDLEFLAGQGAELLFEIARFFADLAGWDGRLGRYRIAGVVGPDEFHDGYPWSTDPGVTDNAYTNVMAAWLLWRADELAGLLASEHRSETAERLGVGDRERQRWEAISRSLNVPFHDGVISQFDGYERLEPIDLDDYRRRYGNIGRLDLILEAEHDAVRRYQVCKQADVLMLLYLFSAEELRTVLGRMGYRLEPETIRRTVDYYVERVTHGSTLSKVVHSWVLARQDRRASWQNFQEALATDVTDSQGGTTREGIHLGAMAGTVDILVRCYAGLEARDEALWLHPLLPTELVRLQFGVRFRGHDLHVDVDHHRLRVEAAPGRTQAATLMVSGEPVALRPGESAEVALDR